MFLALCEQLPFFERGLTGFQHARPLAHSPAVGEASVGVGGTISAAHDFRWSDGACAELPLTRPTVDYRHSPGKQRMNQSKFFIRSFQTFSRPAHRAQYCCEICAIFVCANFSFVVGDFVFIFNHCSFILLSDGVVGYFLTVQLRF